MKTIVFQGDSITDATYPRQYPTELGNGYVTMTAGRITFDYPGQYRCYNRGISGNRSVDMYARIKKDVLNLKPDILTVLIGVNDVWHEGETVTFVPEANSVVTPVYGLTSPDFSLAQISFSLEAKSDTTHYLRLYLNGAAKIYDENGVLIQDKSEGYREYLHLSLYHIYIILSKSPYILSVDFGL